MASFKKNMKTLVNPLPLKVAPVKHRHQKPISLIPSRNFFLLQLSQELSIRKHLFLFRVK